MKKVLTILTVFSVTMAFAALCAIAAEKPVITLERVEVASIQPFFVKPKVMMPSKDDPAKKEEKEGTYGYSSTLNIACILNIKNPGKTPLLLDEIQFTLSFDGFDVNTVTAYEDSWIPGGKTNQLRVIATNEAFTTVVSLSVGAENVQRVQEMKTSAGALVSKWWNDIPDFSFPVGVNGTATFVDDKGKSLQVPFTGKFGAAPAAPAEKKDK